MALRWPRASGRKLQPGGGEEGSARAGSIPSGGRRRSDGDGGDWREADQLTSHGGIGAPMVHGFNEVVVGMAQKLTKPREAVELRGMASNGGRRRPEVAGLGFAEKVVLRRAAEVALDVATLAATPEAAASDS